MGHLRTTVSLPVHRPLVKSMTNGPDRLGTLAIGSGGLPAESRSWQRDDNSSGGSRAVDGEVGDFRRDSEWCYPVI